MNSKRAIKVRFEAGEESASTPKKRLSNRSASKGAFFTHPHTEAPLNRHDPVAELHDTTGRFVPITEVLPIPPRCEGPGPALSAVEANVLQNPSVLGLTARR